VRGALTIANQCRRLEPIETGHIDIEENHCEIPLQHLLQRMLARRRGDEVLPEILQNRPKDDLLVVPVVDDEDIGAVVGDVSGRLHDENERGTA
jgi:hypothetical protein